MGKRCSARARSEAEPYRLGDLMVRAGYKDESSFRAWRVRAEAMGFPPPLPGCTRPLRWARAPVDAWFESGGRAAQKAAQPNPLAPIDELAAARARLKARAGAM
jgi:hypothetical protein